MNDFESLQMGKELTAALKSIETSLKGPRVTDGLFAIAKAVTELADAMKALAPVAAPVVPPKGK